MSFQVGEHREVLEGRHSHPEDTGTPNLSQAQGPMHLFHLAVYDLNLLA